MIEKFLEYVVKNLVDRPDSVSIEVVKRDDMNVFQISVDSADRGKVIGREGQTIKTLRTLVNIVFPQEEKMTVDVVQQ